MTHTFKTLVPFMELKQIQIVLELADFFKRNG